MLPSDSIKHAGVRVTSQSPPRGGGQYQQAARANQQQVAYRGQLINQLKKGKLVEKEKLHFSEPQEPSSKSRQLMEPNLLSFGPAKELRNGTRPSPTVWKSTASSRLLDNSNGKRRAKARDQGAKPKKSQGYFTSKGASGALRSSLGAQDLAISGVLARQESEQHYYPSQLGCEDQKGTPLASSAARKLTHDAQASVA